MESDESIAATLSGDGGSEEKIPFMKEGEVIAFAQELARDTKIDIYSRHSVSGEIQPRLSGIFFLFYVENDDFHKASFHTQSIGRIYYRASLDEQGPYGEFIETNVIAHIRKNT